MTTVLPICFKGDRNYLQGGDIYNALGAYLLGRGETDIADPLIVFHKFAAHQLTVVRSGAEQTAPAAEPVAQFAYTVAGERRKLSVYESAQEVECRNPYPEETIVAAARLDLAEKNIRLETALPFTDVEIMTALNKELLKRLFPDKPGKWFLTRFQAKKYCDKSRYGSLTVTLEHNLNFKLTKSSILLDNDLYGYIFFSYG